MNAVRIAFAAEEDAKLRESVRMFLAARLANVALETRARGWMGFDAQFTRDLAARGWVGLTMPAEYGGGGRSNLTRFAVIEELLAAGAPIAAHWIAERQSGPLLLKYGSERQKRTIVPAICRGEVYFCAGMSESNAGSDLASVRTRAERVADGWRVNGSKLWTTHAIRAHFMIALVRTSGTPADRQAGLSQVLLDMSASGVAVRPILDAGGDEHFAEVSFDDVLVPEDALIGAEGSGWRQVNEELALERSGPERIHSATVLIDAWLRYLRARGDCTREERILAGRLAARLATLRCMSLAVAHRLAAGESSVLDATLVKDLGTEFEQSVPSLIADHLSGETGAYVPGDMIAALRYLQAMSPSFSLRGGTREVLRGIIARGLGLR